MRIVCDGCAAKYSIADDKIRGKVFKIRCKKCSNVIVVRSADEAPVAVAADPGAVWHLVLAGDQVGPLTVDDIGARVAAGEATSETLAWSEGLADWAELAEIETFAALFREATPVEAPALDLPEQIDHAKLRGERNESSVLFSLNNLAKIASTTPKPASSPLAPGGEGSGLIDIRSMASAYLGAGAAPAKAASPIGSIDDLPVFSTSAFSEPAVLVPTPLRPTRSKLMVVMVGAVGVLAAVAIILVVMVMKTSPAQALAVATAEPVKVAPPAAPGPVESTPPPAAPPAPPAPIETPPPPVVLAPPPVVHREAKAHRDPKAVIAQAPPPPPPTEKDSHNCDEVFCLVNPETACCRAHAAPKAAPVKKDVLDPSLPEKLTSSMIGPALSPVRAKAMACGGTSAAKGKVRVHLKVGSDGRVGDVAVDETPDPALGTCVAAAVRRATFPKTQTGGSFAVPYLF